jgi:hypothetical protein
VAAVAKLADELRALSASDRATLERATQILQRTFAGS